MIRMVKLYIVMLEVCKLGNKEQYGHDPHFLEVPEEVNEDEGQGEPHDTEKGPPEEPCIDRIFLRFMKQGYFRDE
jgi:hypothetical protein